MTCKGPLGWEPCNLTVRALPNTWVSFQNTRYRKLALWQSSLLQAQRMTDATICTENELHTYQKASQTGCHTFKLIIWKSRATPHDEISVLTEPKHEGAQMRPGQEWENWISLFLYHQSITRNINWVTAHVFTKNMFWLNQEEMCEAFRAS